MIFYNNIVLGFYCLCCIVYLVNGRISDLKRCADKDCSVPISLATTLLNYAADDDRLVSFSRNSKATVFSKEAGDVPNFWEIEVNRKRGYAPKTFLRENKVLVKNSAVNVIVPTGRVKDLKHNSTQSNEENNHESNDITPKLPPNSKGLFATIGGVSADSVPPNSPDIKPQTSHNYEVISGTTIYDDGTVKTNVENKPPTDELDKSTVDYGTEKFQESTSTSHQNDKETKVPEAEQIIESSEPAKEVNVVEMKAKIPDSILESFQEPQQSDSKPKQNNDEPTDNKQTGSYSEPVIKASEKIKGPKEKGTLSQDTLEDNTTPIESSNEGKEPGILDEMFSYIPSFISSGSGSSDIEEDIEDYDGEENDEEDKNKDDSMPLENKKNGKIELENNEEIVEQLKERDGIENNYDNNSIEEKHLSQDNHNNNSKETNLDLSSGSISINDNSTSDIHTQKLSDENLIKSTDGNDVDTSTKTTNESNSVMDTENNEEKSSSSKKSDTIEITNEKVDVVQQLPISEEMKISTSTKTTNESNSVMDTENNEEKSSSSKVSDTIEITNEKVDVVQQLRTSEETKISNEENLKDTNTESNLSDSQNEKLDKELEVEKPAVLVDSDDNEINLAENSSSQLNDTHESETSTLSGSPTPFSNTDKDVPGYTSSDNAKESQIYLHDDLKTDPFLAKNIGIPDSNKVKRSTDVNDLVEGADKRFQGDDQNGTVVSEIGDGMQPVPNDLKMTDLKSSHTIEQKLENSKKNFFYNTKSLDFKEPEPPVVEMTKHSLIEANEHLSSIKTEQTTELHSLSEPSILEESTSLNINTAEDTINDIDKPQNVFNREEHIKNAGEEEFVKTVHEESSTNVISEEQEDSKVTDDVTTEDASNEISGSWFEPLFNLFSFSESTIENIELDMSNDKVEKEESLFPGFGYNKDDTCAADGSEDSCPKLIRQSEAEPTQTTWQESVYPTDMSATLELLEKVPLDVTIWLIVTAVVVLIFSLGYYYIEAHKRDGPLVAIINKLEREVLVLKKESCILDDRLQIAQEQLETWNTNSSENDALIVELKQELEETKALKAELEEQVAGLEREVETATESGLEMHRLLSESLSSQDGSQVLLSTVESLREKLEHQEIEISHLNQKLSQKNIEVEELEEKLIKSTEVVSSMEGKILSMTRDMEEQTLNLKDQHRQLMAQLEEVMETKALDETRVSAELSKLRLFIEELQKTVAEKDLELEELKEVVKEVRSTDSNEKMDSLFDAVSVRALLKAATADRDDFKERFQEEEGARKLLEGHMKKISQEVAELKNSYEAAEKEKIEALTKLQVLSNYFKEKESQLQKELGVQESLWVQKQSDDHTIYEQMKSLREENEKYKLQNESLKKEIVDQESSFKIQLANVEQKSHEHWVSSRQAERRLKEVQQEAAQLRNRLTMEKNTANYSIDESKHNISESNGDPPSSPPSMLFPATRSPPFMMYPHMPPPGDFVPPPPLMGSPYPSEGRPPPLGRISSPPLDHRFSPPPPLSYAPYEYAPPPYGHHSPSPPPPHHRNVHKPQPREVPRDQKDLSLSNYSPESDKTTRRNKR